jgi:gluconolactonase
MIKDDYVEMFSRKREAPDGTYAATPRADFVYLAEGSKNAMIAGEQGATIMEIYSPVRSDYLEKEGATDLPKAVSMPDFPVPPSIESGKVYDLYDFQYTQLIPGANSRIISGENIQLSFLTMDPGTFFDLHFHPEEQLMLDETGWVNYTTRDGCTSHLTGKYKYDREVFSDLEGIQYTFLYFSVESREITL